MNTTKYFCFLFWVPGNRYLIHTCELHDDSVIRPYHYACIENEKTRREHPEISYLVTLECFDSIEARDEYITALHKYFDEPIESI